LVIRQFPLETPVSEAAFSPDGKRLATTIETLVRLWNASDGSSAGPPLEHAGDVSGLRFSPDGGSLVTWEYPATAQIWSLPGCKRIGHPLRHTLALSVTPQYSQDGNFILTSSSDRTAQIWSATEGSPIGPPFQHGDQWIEAEFSNDGKVIVTKSDSVIHLWQIPRPVAGEPDRLIFWIQVMTGMEILEKTHTVGLLSPEAWRERRRQLAAMGGPPTS
jgi:hypothetical protein